MAEAAELFRRYLTQRLEFGDRDLLLGALTARDALEIVVPQRAHTAQAKVEVAAPPPPPAPLECGWDDLRALALSCTRCGLAQGRTNVVFGEGALDAELLVVGEAPGAEEDRTGRPFVGRAGKLLDRLLESVGFPRESVYICNVLKCRPPGNRNPTPEEVGSCSSFLSRQLALVKPRAILACGTFAAQSLLETTESIGRLRGEAYSYKGVHLIPTYHPAALLRNPAWIRPVWEDLQRLRILIDHSRKA